MEIVFEASHTHLYPGHEGRVSNADAAPTGKAAGTCRIEFADGGVALGSLTHAEGDDWVLDVGPYATAAGTDIPAKRWRVELRQGEGGLTTFRIRGKLAG